MERNMPQLPVACCDGEDWCAVTCTASVLGNKWHAIVVHQLLANGPLGFTALRRQIAGISEKMLVTSLRQLEDEGIVERHDAAGRDRRVEYALTPAGEALRPVLDAMVAWGRAHRVTS